LNLGTRNEPQVVKLNADLDSFVTDAIEQLLKEYKDIFVWIFEN
jgi:hypothetical protein